MKNNGIKIVLVSNNFRDRVGKFAKQLSVPYICMGMKPLPFGIKKAIKMLNISIQNLLVVGDQIFTDVWGANRAGVYSILVKQIARHEEIQIVLKRKLEKIVLRSYRKQK